MQQNEKQCAAFIFEMTLIVLKIIRLAHTCFMKIMGNCVIFLSLITTPRKMKGTIVHFIHMTLVLFKCLITLHCLTYLYTVQFFFASIILPKHS